MWTPEILIPVIATFILAGMVKGVVGLGLPTVALALLTASVGFREALVLMLAPSLITNIWQAFAGPSFGLIFRRFWPMLAAGAAGVWISSFMLTLVDPSVLSAMLGLVLCFYAAIVLIAPQPPTPGRHENWMAPLAGGMSGALAGMTGTFVVPSVIYLQALRLDRNVLIQAMGLWFTTATLMLGLSLNNHGLLPPTLGALSAVAVVPALAGMWLGQKIRTRLSEKLFRQVFLYALFLLGLYIVAKSLF